MATTMGKWNGVTTPLDELARIRPCAICGTDCDGTAGIVRIGHCCPSYPLSVHDVVIGTAYGLDNVSRFYRFATVPAMLDNFRRLQRTYAISDPPLSTLCQSTTPWDE